MRLNKKGMTLVELIISVALLSVVLGFLFKIMLDVKYEDDEAGFAIANQVNRAEIIKEIQNDLLDKEELLAAYVNPDHTIVVLQFGDMSTKQITISNGNKSLSYGSGGNQKKWTIRDENYKFGNITKSEISSCFVKITIPILNNYTDDVLIDDIEIFTKYKSCV